MIANLIGGFVTILIGVSLIAPISTTTNSIAYTCGNGVALQGGPVGYVFNSTYQNCANVSGSNFGNTTASSLFVSSSWSVSVMQMVPGFFALGLLGVGIAVTYSSLRQAGVV